MKNKIKILIICLLLFTACGLSNKFIESQFVQIVTNEYVSYYLDNFGNLFVQGGDPDMIYTKYDKNRDDIFLEKIRSVNIGLENASAISENNELYFWSHRRDGSFKFLSSFKLEENIRKPQIIANEVLKYDDNEDDIMLMLDTGNRLLFIGRFYDGNEYSIDNPLVIDNNVVDMYLGPNFLLYIKEDGTFYGVGNNDNSIITDIDIKLLTTPTKINISENIVSIKGYRDSVMIKDYNDNVFFWGKDILGIDLLKNLQNDANSSYISVKQKINVASNVLDYYLDSDSFIIVDKRGDCRFWGSLGNEITTYQGIVIANNIKYCLLNNNNVMLLNEDGRSMSWGSNKAFNGRGKFIEDEFVRFDENPLTW